MRHSIIGTLIFLGLASLAAADTIYLKNGRTIVADSTHEINGRIEYQIGEDSYAVAKSAVDHIDTAGVPMHSSSGRHEEMPITPPVENINRSGEVADKLIKDGHVDPSAIADVEKVGSNELSAAAYYVAGKFEYSNGDREKARRYVERGLIFLPDSSPLLDLYVATLISLHRAPTAISYAQHATRVAPNSADSFYLLGQAYFQSDRTEEAIKAWKRSLQLRPDPEVQDLLEKAERESSAESKFTEAATGHFTLHYEGGVTPDGLRRDILSNLEAHYSELVGELGAAPRESISVSLYTQQAFFDITQAPSWTGALYDGKLRIPVDGLNSVTPALSRVLKHELTHSFIRDITRGRCPQWLNEGVAQAMEPQSVAPVGHRLEQLYVEQRQVPLSALEGSWMGLSNGEASLAYVEGLAGVEYIRDTYGMGDIVRLLQRIGDGSSTEAALRSTLHGGYADLEDGLTGYLKKTYGP